jgi:hypothetical protein
MHPHENPVYQSNLLNSFMSAYFTQTLKLREEPEAKAFEREISTEAKKTFVLQLAGLTGVIYLDRKYFAPKAAGAMNLQRLLCVTAGFLLSLRASVVLGQSQTKLDLAKQLALKYERELMDINPALRTFYLPVPGVQDLSPLPQKSWTPDSAGEVQKDWSSDWTTDSSPQEQVRRPPNDWRGETWAPGQGSSGYSSPSGNDRREAESNSSEAGPSYYPYQGHRLGDKRPDS